MSTKDKFSRFCFLTSDLTPEQIGFVKGLRKAHYTLRMVAEVFCDTYPDLLKKQGIDIRGASGNQLFGDDLLKAAGMDSSKE